MIFIFPQEPLNVLTAMVHIQGQELRNKRREQAVISQCKHRMLSKSVICVCISDILPRVLVDCKRRFAAFITEWNTSLGVIHIPGKG